jgi:phenylpropionate dioxygenase-like ring-hydroxylating dioxygenase large terminal subunit
VMIDVGVAPTGTGAPQGDRSQGVSGYVINATTPETGRSHHYFLHFVRNYKVGDRRLTQQIADAHFPVLREDQVVLEAQQRAIDDHPARRFNNLSIDSGSVRARRILEKMIAAEPEQAPAK